MSPTRKKERGDSTHTKSIICRGKRLHSMSKDYFIHSFYPQSYSIAPINDNIWHKGLANATSQNGSDS